MNIDVQIGQDVFQTRLISGCPVGLMTRYFEQDIGNKSWVGPEVSLQRIKSCIDCCWVHVCGFVRDFDGFEGLVLLRALPDIHRLYDPWLYRWCRSVL